MRIHSGYRVLDLPFNSETAILHRWASGYRELFRRHLRDLALEPVQRAAAGEVTGYREIARMPWRRFYESFVRKSGYRDGRTGLALSLFWAGFKTAGEIGLLRRLRRNKA